MSSCTSIDIHTKTRAAFTLIELLVVIAIIAILSVVVILTLNPAELLRQSRDANRVFDMATMNSALGIYQTDQGNIGSLGSASVVYVSLPDTSATCANLGLPALPMGYTYNCTPSTSTRSTNATGWIPLNFQTFSEGSPFGSLPIDPTNTPSSRLYYTYDTNNSQYEITASMESSKYKLGGSNDVISGDGGTLASVYEKGTGFGLEPLDYGDPTLVGYWPLSEGTGSVAYDDSGNNATGSWSGTQAGTSGYYSGGKVRSYAGVFDGSSDMVSTTGIIPLTMQATVSLWINTPTVSAFGAKVLAEISTNISSNNAFVITFNDNSGGAVPTIGGFTLSMKSLAGFSLFATNNRYDGAWHLLTVVYDRTQSTFAKQTMVYVDGSVVPVTQVAGYNAVHTTPFGSYPFFIGARSGTLYPFSGSLDDVRIYNRALSALEIQAMYNGKK